MFHAGASGELRDGGRESRDTPCVGAQSVRRAAAEQRTGDRLYGSKICTCVGEQQVGIVEFRMYALEAHTCGSAMRSPADGVCVKLTLCEPSHKRSMSRDRGTQSEKWDACSREATRSQLLERKSYPDER